MRLFKHYLKEVRPRLPGAKTHDGLWASCKRRPISAGRLYDIARARVYAKFGKDMGLHDFRRSAAIHLAMDAPDKIGLIPGMMQHTSPKISEQQYNLARGIKASQRFAASRAHLKAKLRQLAEELGDITAEPLGIIQTRRKLPGPLNPAAESDHAREHLRPLFIRSPKHGLD